MLPPRRDSASPACSRCSAVSATSASHSSRSCDVDVEVEVDVDAIPLLASQPWQMTDLRHLGQQVRGGGDPVGDSAGDGDG